jgi:hypothetical protein
MKTEYKYIHFEKVQHSGKTEKWECINNHSNCVLATIKWYAPWRQYSFFSEYGSVFNLDCLNDINHFITQLMDARRVK